MARNRGGKAAFYRIGVLHGFHNGGSLRPWARVGAPAWPAWAKQAYCAGALHGKGQLLHARCIHEPWPNANRPGDPVCYHCGMKMRALRRGKA